MAANAARAIVPAPLLTKRTNTAPALYRKVLGPLESFTAVVSVFQAHLPVHDG
jgi:hypothetical protein